LTYLGYFLGKPTHLRFLRNISVSFWQTYSKPTSSNAFISLGSSATFTVNSSFPFSPNIVRSIVI